MVNDIVNELRAIALKCMKIARECRDGELSRALQDLGIELAAKASVLEENFDR